MELFGQGAQSAGLGTLSQCRGFTGSIEQRNMRGGHWNIGKETLGFHKYP